MNFDKLHQCTDIMYFLVSTYIVCERLSVMHQQARLPENFDQILQNTPVLQFGSRTPPQIKIVPRVQVQPYPEHAPPNEKL